MFEGQLSEDIHQKGLRDQVVARLRVWISCLVKSNQEALVVEELVRV